MLIKLLYPSPRRSPDHALGEAYDTRPAKEAIFPVATHTKVSLVSSEIVTATDIF